MHALLAIDPSQIQHRREKAEYVAALATLYVTETASHTFIEAFTIVLIHTLTHTFIDTLTIVLIYTLLQYMAQKPGE